MENKNKSQNILKPVVNSNASIFRNYDFTISSDGTVDINYILSNTVQCKSAVKCFNDVREFGCNDDNAIEDTNTYIDDCENNFNNLSTTTYTTFDTETEAVNVTSSTGTSLIYNERHNKLESIIKKLFAITQQDDSHRWQVHNVYDISDHQNKYNNLRGQSCKRHMTYISSTANTNDSNLRKIRKKSSPTEPNVTKKGKRYLQNSKNNTEYTKNNNNLLYLCHKCSHYLNNTDIQRMTKSDSTEFISNKNRKINNVGDNIGHENVDCKYHKSNIKIAIPPGFSPLTKSLSKCLLDNNKLSNKLIIRKGDVNISNHRQNGVYQILGPNCTQLAVKKSDNSNKEIQESMTIVEQKIDLLIQSINTLAIEIQTNTESARFGREKTIEIFNSRKELLERKLFRDCDSVKSDILGLSNDRDTSIFQMVESQSRPRIENNVSSCDTNNYLKADVTNFEASNIPIESRVIKIPLNISFDKHSDNNPQFTTKITLDIVRGHNSDGTANETNSNNNANIFNKTLVRFGDEIFYELFVSLPRQVLKYFISFMEQINQFSSYENVNTTVSNELIDTSICYECHICGLTFKSSYELSDHIFEHNFGDTTCCKICEELGKKRKDAVSNGGMMKSRFFHCNFCGQHFRRAYCAQLHQCTCPLNPYPDRMMETNLDVLS